MRRTVATGGAVLSHGIDQLSEDGAERSNASIGKKLTGLMEDKSWVKGVD